MLRSVVCRPIIVHHSSSRYTSLSHIHETNKSDIEAFNKQLEIDSGRIYRGRPSLDLLRSLFVFQACGFSSLVAAAPTLLQWSKTLHLTPITHAAIRATFFKQFCGGETAQDIIPALRHLKGDGIGSILDLALEADVHDVNITASTDERTLQRVRSEEIQRHEMNAERTAHALRESLAIAGTVAYSGQAAWAANREEFIQSRRIDAIVCIKVTSLASPLLLASLHDALVTARSCFDKLVKSHSNVEDKHHPSQAVYQQLGIMNYEVFQQFVKSLPRLTNAPIPIVDIHALFKQMDADNDGNIDWIDVCRVLHIQNGSARPLLLNLLPMHVQRPSAMTGPERLAQQCLTEADLLVWDKIMARLSALCRDAEAARVSLMIDAEQTYFQRAIDHVAQRLSVQFNKITAARPLPMVYQTYQCYLVDSRRRLEEDLRLMDRCQCHFASKLVRGAYMVAERERAHRLGYVSPIHTTIEETHSCYNGAASFLLHCLSEQLKNKSDAVTRIVIASHNKMTSALAVHRLKQLSLLSHAQNTGLVAFAQLYGMCEPLTYTVSRPHTHLVAYKYVPYGPVGEVIPYLLRRAQENGALLGQTGNERDALLHELKRRLLPFSNRVEDSVQEKVIFPRDEALRRAETPPLAQSKRK